MSGAKQEVGMPKNSDLKDRQQNPAHQDDEGLEHSLSPKVPLHRALNTPAASLKPADMALQRSIGNRAAQTLLAKRAAVNRLPELGPRDANGVAEGAEAAVERANSSSGQPLPGSVRNRFERSLGAELSRVQIHTGSGSAEAAAVGAKAYTVGQDIHFGAGQYAPTDAAGLHLLAHEAHTVQHGGTSPRRQRKPDVSAPGDAAELEADRAADAMVSDGRFSVSKAEDLSRQAISRGILAEPKGIEPKEAAEKGVGVLSKVIEVRIAAIQKQIETYNGNLKTYSYVDEAKALKARVWEYQNGLVKLRDKAKNVEDERTKMEAAFKEFAKSLDKAMIKKGQAPKGSDENQQGAALFVAIRTASTTTEGAVKGLSSGGAADLPGLYSELASNAGQRKEGETGIGGRPADRLNPENRRSRVAPTVTAAIGITKSQALRLNFLRS
jgi:hypothetical protein